MSKLVRKLSEKRTQRRAARKQTVLSSLIKQRDQALAMKEKEIADELQEQIDSITAPPSIGSVYRIMLASSHYRSYSGTFLDAHRSIARDRRSTEATFVNVHTDSSHMRNKYKEREERKQLAGHWLLEGLTKEELVSEFPALAKKVNVFRLKLLTSHFGCPSGSYLCGVSVHFNSKKIDNSGGKKSEKITKKDKAVRSNDSTWCFVQPLWQCNAYTSSLWTLEPADGKFGENGLWKIRLVSTSEAKNETQTLSASHKRRNQKAEKRLAKDSKNADSAQSTPVDADIEDEKGLELQSYEKEYLEVHRSKLSDARNPYSTYVHIHTNNQNHAGEWFFEEVYDKNKSKVGDEDVENFDEDEDNYDDEDDDVFAKNVKFDGRHDNIDEMFAVAGSGGGDSEEGEGVPLTRRLMNFFSRSNANRQPGK